MGSGRRRPPEADHAQRNHGEIYTEKSRQNPTAPLVTRFGWATVIGTGRAVLANNQTESPALYPGLTWRHLERTVWSWRLELEDVAEY
jgi:hypothetical protein